MEQILALMLRLTGLKQTLRTGWNLKFPQGHRFRTRTVARPESVADHSWNLAMLALACADKLGLDPLKMVWISLIHDVAEVITGDCPVLTFDKDDQERVRREKRAEEDAAMRELFLPMGAWGRRCYELWLEYADGTSVEARVIKELDKLEACIQALMYREQGEAVEPEEFFSTADSLLTHPDFIKILALLREHAAASLPTQQTA